MCHQSIVTGSARLDGAGWRRPVAARGGAAAAVDGATARGALPEQAPTMSIATAPGTRSQPSIDIALVAPPFASTHGSGDATPARSRSVARAGSDRVPAVGGSVRRAIVAADRRTRSSVRSGRSLLQLFRKLRNDPLFRFGTLRSTRRLSRASSARATCARLCDDVRRNFRYTVATTAAMTSTQRPDPAPAATTIADIAERGRRLRPDRLEGHQRPLRRGAGDPPARRGDHPRARLPAADAVRRAGRRCSS